MSARAKCSASVITLGVVILAAGASRRMGRPKLLLPWGPTSVLGHLLEQWQELGAAQISVVSAAADEVMRAELYRIAFPAQNLICNPAPEGGMFSSIQCAARWTGWKPGLTHWSIALGDQPHLCRETLQAVLDLSAAQPDKVCQPRHAGHRRHPVLLPKAVFQDLAGSHARDLKEFLLPYDTASCEVDDVGLDLDIDRPEDYQRARSLYPGYP